MKILHVLSQFEVTGAEAYAVSLIEEQMRSGHSAFVVSDTLTLATTAKYIPLPIGERSYRQRLRNIAALRHLIYEHSIDLVHAHSRAASWVAFFATRLTRTALVSTVHGRQHVHTSSRSFSIYGKDIIAVCVALTEHLINDLGLDPQSIVMIPNCIPLHRWEEAAASRSTSDGPQHTEGSLVVFPGRLTGPKGDVVRFLLSKVLPLALPRKKIRFRVIGGMITPEDMPRAASALNAEFQEPIVELRGFKHDLPQQVLKADLVIGSGRVVPESMVLRRPVIAFGESSYIGPITPGSYDEAARTNFGDTGIPTVADPESVAADILRVLENTASKVELETLAQLARDQFDSCHVANKVQRMYERAYARAHSPQSIPVLMYHQVIETPGERSPHGIWVTADQFSGQLHSLHRRGFETITFNDYLRFSRGESKLPKRPIILTFDDGYEDNFTVAFPLLQKFGFRGVIFAVTDWNRRTNFWDQDVPSAPLLTPTQLKELADSGIEIGSHSVTHPRLSAAPIDKVRCELRDSKDALEQLLGTPILSFAYPYGAVDEVIKNLVEGSGYKFAVAADSGPIPFFQDFLEIRRTQVFPWTARGGFWKKTLPLYSRYRNLKASA
jgi:peptidoglycan/xylan/chitin deacetylase (PgdA/CDA1 family)